MPESRRRCSPRRPRRRASPGGERSCLHRSILNRSCTARWSAGPTRYSATSSHPKVSRSRSRITSAVGQAAHYEFQEVRGDRCIDEAADITPVIHSGAQVAPPAAAAATDTDPVLASLKARGLWKREIKPGAHAIVCPWAAEHTHEYPASATATAYLMKNFEGRTHDGFKCMHSSCANRSLGHLLEKLGLRGEARVIRAKQRCAKRRSEPSAIAAWAARDQGVRGKRAPLDRVVSPIRFVVLRRLPRPDTQPRGRLR